MTVHSIAHYIEALAVASTRGMAEVSATLRLMDQPDGQQRFQPRLAGSQFACKFCAAPGMQWLEQSLDKWVPFDLGKNSVHQCRESGEVLSREDVLQYLCSLGFEAYVPRTSSWTHVFAASNRTRTLYFLVGKRTFDFKLYDHVRSEQVDSKGKLATDGGQMVRNYYHDSDVNIHQLIQDLATRFVADDPIDESWLVGHGTSWKKVLPNESTAPAAAADEGGDMAEIYDAISGGDGQDAYLGDGMWLSADGGLHDRGR